MQSFKIKQFDTIARDFFRHSRERPLLALRCFSYTTKSRTQPGRLLVSLERSVGARQGVDKDLSSQGGFDCEVYPDLPVDTDWRGFFGRLLSRQEQEPASLTTAKTAQRQLIRTVGCQVRSKEALHGKLLQAAKDDADGILVLSGSHPANKLATYFGRTPSSTELLKDATLMKQQGKLPSTLALWAVENPLRNPASRLAIKLDAGADTVLTQPPLAWEAFSAWWQRAHSMGLTEQGTVVVGIPMITSIGNLQFWLQLCKAAALPEAKALVAHFKAETGKDHFATFLKDYNRSLIKQVRELPGIGGVHIMPLTKAARQQVLEFQSDGTLSQARL